jgi:hypothetical protein
MGVRFLPALDFALQGKLLLALMNGNSSFRKIVSQFRKSFAVPQNRFAKDAFFASSFFA